MRGGVIKDERRIRGERMGKRMRGRKDEGRKDEEEKE